MQRFTPPLEGQERATALIDMAKSHPGATQEVWALADPLVQQIKAQIPGGLWARKRPQISFESLLSAGD